MDTAEGRTCRPSADAHRGDECYAAGATAPDSRRARCAAHVTTCPKRPAASGDVERRRRCSKVKRRQEGISVHNAARFFEK
jgi:hypothetical protein